MVVPDEITKEAMRKMSNVTQFNWERTLSILPRKCSMSQTWIPMFSMAYKGKNEIIDCGPRQVYCLEVAWISPAIYAFQKLKGNIK